MDHDRHRKATDDPYLIPALRHSDTTTAEPIAQRNTRPLSPALKEAHAVIRALELQSRGRGPPQEDMGSDFNLEVIPTAPLNGAPAGPTPPAGSIQALCPAWKRGHCTGEGWYPRQHPRPAANNGALPAVGYAAARAPLLYGVAQDWIQDDTTCSSLNIQEAVDRVAHTGQTEVVLHTRGRHSRQAEGKSWSPSGWC